MATLTQLHNASNASCDVTAHLRGKWACVMFFAHAIYKLIKRQEG